MWLCPVLSSLSLPFCWQRMMRFQVCKTCPRNIHNPCLNGSKIVSSSEGCANHETAVCHPLHDHRCRSCAGRTGRRCTDYPHSDERSSKSIPVAGRSLLGGVPDVLP